MDDFEKEVRLIDFVRDNPCIWDKRYSSYKNKTLKEKVWITLSKELGMEAEECVKVWTNLKAQFLAHRRKLKRPSGSSAGTRPYFRHEAAMQFLNDVNDGESSYSNLETDMGAVTFDENEVLNIQLEEFPSTELPTTSGSKTVSPAMQLINRSHSKSKKRKGDDFEQEMIQLLKKDEDDEFQAFGRLVAAKLRKLQNQNPALYHETWHFICTILNDAEMKQYNAGNE